MRLLALPGGSTKRYLGRGRRNCPPGAKRAARSAATQAAAPRGDQMNAMLQRRLTLLVGLSLLSLLVFVIGAQVAQATTSSTGEGGAAPATTPAAGTEVGRGGFGLAPASGTTAAFTTPAAGTEVGRGGFGLAPASGTTAASTTPAAGTEVGRGGFGLHPRPAPPQPSRRRRPGPRWAGVASDSHQRPAPPQPSRRRPRPVRPPGPTGSSVRPWPCSSSASARGHCCAAAGSPRSPLRRPTAHGTPKSSSCGAV